jgi:hypothetical protein
MCVACAVVHVFLCMGCCCAQAEREKQAKLLEQQDAMEARVKVWRWLLMLPHC